MRRSRALPGRASPPGAPANADVETDAYHGSANMAAEARVLGHGVPAAHFSSAAMLPSMRSQLLLTALAVSAAAWGPEIVLNPDPAPASVRFTLPATLHTVPGSFKLTRGAIRFHPAPGKISGEVAVD